MSGCSNYAENLWKKGKCSNCFRAKEQHKLESRDDGQNHGDTSWSKPTYVGSKKLTTHSNGHSRDREPTSKKNGDDGKEFMLKSKSHTGKILGTTASDLTNTPALPSLHATHQNGVSKGKPASLRKEGEYIDSIDKPRPTPRHRQRSSSKNSSVDEDFLKSPTETPSAGVTDFTLTGTHKSNTTTTDISPINKPGNSADSHSKQLKSGGICPTRENGLKTMEGKERTKPTNESADMAKLDNDVEYMPMNNNVCNDENPSADRKVEPIKIASPNPNKQDDKNTDNKSLNTNSVSLDSKTNKQVSDERYNNIPISPTSPIKLSNQVNTRNDKASDAVNSEPFYENRSRVGSERSGSSSSEKSLCKPVSTPSDRPDSIAFKVQIDIDEIRASSIFEDVIVEASGSSCATTSSSKSSSSNASDDYDTSADDQGTSQPEASTSESQTTKTQDNNSRRHSNPDVTDLLEQPSYTNSSVKPQTKPYKVVDISGCVIVPDSDADNANIPPLPPKEKELNRQKETSGPDHYYYEPPDDIVPDYKKLTPLNTEPPPPPVVVKKDGQGVTVPAALKSMPVPRPRSQVRSSYTSSTLPRPIPRATKSGLEVKELAHRPVSQG